MRSAAGLERTVNFLLSRQTLTLLLGMAGPALILRTLAVARYSGPGPFDLPALALLFRGFASDVFFSYAVSLICGWWLVGERRVFVIWTLVWSFVFAGNVEHISYNHSNLSVLFAEYAAAPEFIAGNVLVAEVFLRCLVAFAVTWAALWWIESRSSRLPGNRWLAVGLGLSGLALWIPTTPRHDDWIQETLVETNMKHLIAHSGRPSGTIAHGEELRELDADLMEKYLVRDLEGERRFTPERKRPNILIVLIEGLGDTYVNERTMPYLHRLGGENLRFSNFFSHQHPTIKGVYSLLSGDYPNLKGYDSKADVIGAFGAKRPLLPRLLVARGYSTVFLQGAPLGYMRKDLFAQEAGFRKIYGAAAFASAHRRGRWGVDDRTLFERVSKEIGELKQPWMMTVLTSGTHPPYNVPEDFHGEPGQSALEVALRYTDTYLKALIEELRHEGALANTIVFITSDEVKGHFRPGIEGVLDSYRGPLVVCTPEGYRETVTERYGHLDLTLSVLDYLGETKFPPGVKGRSLFRRYGSPRNLLVGRANDILLLDDSGRVHFVSDRFDHIDSYTRTESGYQALDAGEHLIREVEQVVDYSDVVASEVDSEYIFRDGKRYVSGDATLIGQLSCAVGKGEVLTWDIAVSAEYGGRDVSAVAIRAGVMGDDGKYTYLVSDELVLGPRSRIDFSRSVEAPQDLDRLDTFVSVRTPPGKKAFVDHVHVRRGLR